MVFKVAPDGTETVLYTFTGHSESGRPVAGLLADGAGNLYGATLGVRRVERWRGVQARRHRLRHEWQLRDSSGALVSALSAVKAVTYQSVPCSSFWCVPDEIPDHERVPRSRP